MSMPANATTPVFFVVAVPKLILMTLLTGGLYGLFWYQRNWDCYGRAVGGVVVPYMLWPELFLYSLLSRVDQRIRASGRGHDWSPWWLTCGLLLTSMLVITATVMSLPVPAWSSALLLLIPLFSLALGKIQRAINFCEGDPEGEGNARLSPVNGMWILVVTLGWLVLEGSAFSTFPP